jgi:uncharacterized protein YjgD (DUF1641 family)
MTVAAIEDRIAALDVKLDFIVEELSHLRQLRQSGEDLVADLTIVGKDALGDAAEALGAAALRPAEIGQLIRTVLRDAALLTSALRQLESAADFIEDAQPIVRDLFRQAIAGSQVLEQKGYFNAARAGVRIGDSLIQSHSAEDLKQVEASVPQLIGFLRELTRPEVLQALEAIIHGFGRVQATMDVDKSFFGLARDLNSTEARRGMAILVEFLKVVGARGAAAVPAIPSTHETIER